MSLSEAVLSIASAMEEEGERFEDQGPHGDLTNTVLRQFASQLRLVVKASSPSSAPQGDMSPWHAWEEPERKGRPPVDWQKLEAQRLARDMERKGEQVERAQSLLAEQQTFLVGGPDDGVVVPAPRDDVPEGARTIVGGNIYRVGKDRKLHFEKAHEPSQGEE